MTTKAVKLTEEAIANALLYGPTVSAGIMAMHEKIQHTESNKIQGSLLREELARIQATDPASTKDSSSSSSECGVLPASKIERTDTPTPAPAPVKFVTPEPAPGTIPACQPLTQDQVEKAVRKIVQEEGVMLHRKQHGFFQELNRALIMAMSEHNKI